MKCVICDQPIEEERKQGQPPLLVKYCLKRRAGRRKVQPRNQQKEGKVNGSNKTIRE